MSNVSFIIDRIFLFVFVIYIQPIIQYILYNLAYCFINLLRSHILRNNLYCCIFVIPVLMTETSDFQCLPGNTYINVYALTLNHTTPLASVCCITCLILQFLQFLCSRLRPSWPKRPAIIVIDSATYLLTISSLDTYAISIKSIVTFRTKDRGMSLNLSDIPLSAVVVTCSLLPIPTNGLRQKEFSLDDRARQMI